MMVIMVNWHDAQVRHAVYQMISSTLSIFCAVLFNQALFSFIWKQLLVGDPTKRMQYPWGGDSFIPRGFGMKLHAKEKSITAGLACLVSLYVLQSFCFRFRKDGPGFITLRSYYSRLQKSVHCGLWWGRIAPEISKEPFPDSWGSSPLDGCQPTSSDAAESAAREHASVGCRSEGGDGICAECHCSEAQRSSRWSGVAMHCCRYGDLAMGRQTCSGSTDVC